jgi:hypothetical protein
MHQPAHDPSMAREERERMIGIRHTDDRCPTELDWLESRIHFLSVNISIRKKRVLAELLPKNQQLGVRSASSPPVKSRVSRFTNGDCVMFDDFTWVSLAAPAPIWTSQTLATPGQARYIIQQVSSR